MNNFQYGFYDELTKVAASESEREKAELRAVHQLPDKGTGLLKSLAAVLGPAAIGGAAGFHLDNALDNDAHEYLVGGALLGGAGGAAADSMRNNARQAKQFKELGLKSNLGRLSAAGLGAGYGGLAGTALGGLLALIAQKTGHDMNIEDSATRAAIKGSLLGGVLGLSNPASVGGVTREKPSLKQTIKNKLKSLVGKK
jgi:hypothetical protein